MTIEQLMETPAATLTCAVAAKVIGCDPRTVKQACDNGTFASLRMGNRTLILKEPFIALLKGGAGFGG